MDCEIQLVYEGLAQARPNQLKMLSFHKQKQASHIKKLALIILWKLLKSNLQPHGWKNGYVKLFNTL